MLIPDLRTIGKVLLVVAYIAVLVCATHFSYTSERFPTFISGVLWLLGLLLILAIYSPWLIALFLRWLGHETRNVPPWNLNWLHLLLFLYLSAFYLGSHLRQKEVSGNREKAQIIILAAEQFRQENGRYPWGLAEMPGMPPPALRPLLKAHEFWFEKASDDAYRLVFDYGSLMDRYYSKTKRWVYSD